jgi:serine protease AprX
MMIGPFRIMLSFLILVAFFTEINATKVLIVLKNQAPITGVEQLKTKQVKSNYLYNLLYNHSVTTQASLISYLQNQGVPHRRYYIVNMIYADVNSTQISYLQSHIDVASVVADGNFTLPIIAEERGVDRAIEWGLSMIKAPEVWAKGYNGSGIVIGGQDTGYDWDHPALINSYRGWNGVNSNHNYNWHDAIHSSIGNPCGNNSTMPCDDDNHGTHTMGSMTGDDGLGNQIGVAPGAKWIGCRNMNKGDGTLSTYLECFEWLLAPYPVDSTTAYGNPNYAPHVINNSWSCPPSEGCNTSNFAIMEQAVNTLKAAGIVVVVSAGNSGSNCGTISNPPAIFENSFSVGATNETDVIAGFSSRGPVTIDGSNRVKPNISAPGVRVRSSILGGGYAQFSGTSMAGPHVAGAVALLLDARPDLDGEVEKIESILELTADRKTSTQNCIAGSGTSIPNNTYGYGRINILSAINYMTQHVKVDNADWYLPNFGSSIILTSPNGNTWSVYIDNLGNISTNLSNLDFTNSINIENASLFFTSIGKGIIIPTGSGSNFRLKINNGSLVSELVNTIPTPYVTHIGNVEIKSVFKGLVLKDNTGMCYETTVNNNGSLSTSLITCFE